MAQFTALRIASHSLIFKNMLKYVVRIFSVELLFGKAAAAMDKGNLTTEYFNKKHALLS